MKKLREANYGICIDLYLCEYNDVITCRSHVAWAVDYGQSVETIPYKSEFVLYVALYL